MLLQVLQAPTNTDIWQKLFIIFCLSGIHPSYTCRIKGTDIIPTLSGLVVALPFAQTFQTIDDYPFLTLSVLYSCMAQSPPTSKPFFPFRALTISRMAKQLSRHKVQGHLNLPIQEGAASKGHLQTIYVCTSNFFTMDDCTL